MTTASHQQTAIKRRIASLARWLHIYLSMATFVLLFFFAVTGLTLNHTDWFSQQQRTTQYKGQLNTVWLAAGSDAANNNQTVDKLAIVEALRRAHGIKGAVSDFRVEEDQATVTFKGPGYAADAFIQRATGAYELTETRNGLVAVLNDLHKGRDTGRVWSWLIDAAAILMTLVSFTGIVLIWFIKRRRVSGLILAVVGGVLCYVLYVIWVP